MAGGASTTDASRVPTVDASRIQWKEATSANGAKYQIGILKPDHSDMAEWEEEDFLGPTKLQERHLRTVRHDISVYWELTEYNDYWKTPVQQVKDKVDIDKYCLTKNYFSIFDWILWINNTQDWDYVFYDETGDSYKLSTFRSGTHHVSFNSTKPNIVKIYATS